MVEADFAHPEIQEALAPGRPDLHIVTSTEGLTYEDQVIQARRATSMIALGRNMLSKLPDSAIEEVSSVDEVFRRHGIDTSEESGKETTSASDSEPPQQRNERSLAREFTEEEQAKIQEIIDGHKAQAAPQAGHIAVTAA